MDIQQKSANDKLLYIQRQVKKVESTLEVFRFLPPIFIDRLNIFSDYAAPSMLISRNDNASF